VRRLALSFALLALARSASAYPFLAIHPSGTPFEGPADFEPTSIWWNPAALAALRGLHVQFNGGLAAKQGTIARSAIDSSTGLPGGAGDRAFPAVALHDNAFRYFGAATWDFGLDTVTFGFSVSAPWDASQSFADDRTGSTLALPTAYHLASESFQNIFFSVALALKLHPKWLVGLSLSPVDSFADVVFYRDTALDGGSALVKQSNALCGGPCGYENPAAAARVHVHGDGGVFWDTPNFGGGPGLPIPLGLAMNWGIAFRPVERLWMGISWQHVFPLAGPGSGYERAYVAPSEIAAQVTPPSASGACGGTCTGADAIGFALPDVFHLGARITIREDLEVETWGRLITYGGYGTSSDPALSGLVVRVGSGAAQGGVPEQIVINHKLRPAFAAEAGVRWRPRPSLRLGLSITLESSAVPSDQVDAEAIDAPKLDATVGAEWRARRWLRLLLAYGLTALVPVDGSGGYDPSARVRCVDSGGSIDACAADLAGNGLPAADGRYTLVTHHLTAGFVLDF